MTKAKSRLRSGPMATLSKSEGWGVVKKANNEGWGVVKKANSENWGAVVKNPLTKKETISASPPKKISQSGWWSDYWGRLRVSSQDLILAIFFYFLTILLMNNVYPSQIADFPLVDSYLIFQLLAGAGNFFLARFFTQKNSWSLGLALLIAGVLFFRFQGML